MTSYPPPIENLPIFNSLVFAESQSSSSNHSTPSTSGSAPTGAISFYFGTAAPEGWLICDGKEYNILSYPDLYTLLGSSNTPNLQGCFLRGTGTNSSYTNLAGQSVSGQALGTYAQDSVGQHYHTFNANQDNLTIRTGTTASGAGAFNRLQYLVFNGKQYNSPAYGNDEVDMNIKTLQTNTGVNIAGTTNQFPSLETYPCNIAVNYIIKT